MIYDISYKTLIGSKRLRTTFRKTDGVMKIYDRTRFLTLFGTKKYDPICNRIRYLITLKSSITFIFSHYFVIIKVDFYDSLPIEKAFTFHNVIIRIK